MVDLHRLQSEVYDNKIAKGFNTTNIEQEFCFIHEELAEAYRAYRKRLPDLGEELADVAIYLLGLSHILNVDLEKEILNKMEINKRRTYKMVNGDLEKVGE